jgi:acyl carrier protein
MTERLETLKQEIKELIIKECEKEMTPADITDDEILFGPRSNVQLNSIDALQISVALKRKYNVDLHDSKVLRRVMSNVANLAEHIVSLG